MRHYTPRRASKRWLDGDCPAGVLAILDNRGKTIDRYTVIYSEPITYPNGDTYIGLRDMSADPFHPQGVGMWGEYPEYVIREYRYRNKHHYARWSDLPAAVQRAVKQDLEVTE